MDHRYVDQKLMRRFLGGLLALTVTSALVPAAAQASPAETPAETPAATGPVPGAPAAVTTHELTLITGDRVTLTVHGPDGPYETEVTAAPRAGAPPLFMGQVGPDGLYVVPSDVAPAVDSGRVDRELFNVTGLVEQGYADDEADALPVIVSYPRSASSALRGLQPSAAELAGRADRLPATSDAVGLASVNGAGVEVAKEQAAEFWQRLGSARVWLDGTAELVLDESVPLVGAPDAWAAGYDGTGTTVAVIDTGVDLNHPDLAGKVTTAESFVDGLPPQDGHGHGTHVASTIAGSGAASSGQYTGVAPGAELVSGRVCNDGGQCAFSDMIAGMEWAVQEMDADIVSMSLGGDPSDGTDPLSQAVNSLTASTGALFVIAAGNSGQDRAVGSPGAADAALTVAATDKSDGLASFSSRGPRFGDMALKPDIAAPGVDIVAARSSTGTDMGGGATPVGEQYVSASGTSMATPHVSGAAAILAQRHPDWGPEQLKAALMSTAADAGHTVYQQGAGRLDAGRAATQQVYATTANLDFGLITIPDDGEPEPAPVTSPVSYVNVGEQSVTLTLAATLSTTDGDPVPAGALATDPTVTVPAGGTATVDVTLDPSGLGQGWYTGAVVAVDAATGARVTTPVGLVREPPKVTLTIRTLGRDGQPVTPGGTHIIDVSGRSGIITELTSVGEGVTAARVPEGVYSVAQLVGWVDEESRFNGAWLFNPELTVDGDTEIVLDARSATQVTFDTPQPSEPLPNHTISFYQRTTAGGEPLVGYVLGDFNVGGGWMRLWATPTAPVTVGEFRFAHEWTFGDNAMAMSVVGPGELTLHPATPLTFWSERGLVDNFMTDALQFRGTVELPLVDAGNGTPEELAGRDLTGKLALVATSLVNTGFGLTCGLSTEQIAAVRDAGAAGIVAYPGAEVECPIPMQVVPPSFSPHQTVGIRYAFLPTLEARALLDQLATGPVTLRVTGAPEQSSYLNVLKPYEEGRIPDSLRYTLTEQDLMVTDVDLHAPESRAISEFYYLWKQDDRLISATSSSWFGPDYLGPGTRRHYVGPIDPEVLFLHGASQHPSDGFGHWRYDSMLENRQTVADLLDQPEHTREQWFTEPQSPGPAVTSDAAYAAVDPTATPGFSQLGNIACSLCREGNMLVGLSYMVAGGLANLQHDDHVASTGEIEYRLFRDGAEIPSIPLLHIPGFELPADEGSYRLELTTPEVDTTWQFTSGPPVEQARQFGHACLTRDVFPLQDGPCAPVPAVFVSYDLGDSLALDNTVRARGAHKFDVYAYHHPSPLPMPDIAGLKLWVSYDDGAHWTPVRVRDAGDGRHEVTLVHPRPDRRASDQVSLKVEAWDVAGNRVEQVTRDAFTLRDATATNPAVLEAVPN